MSMQLRGQIKPTYKMPRFENGHQGDPTIGFDTSRDTGIYHDDGLCITHHGTRVMQIGQVITVDAPIVGDASGLSNVSAANVVGLTAALDVIDASSVSSNVFIGNGAGLSNIAAGNITGLTAALDVIDASSVTADNLTVTSLSSNLTPSANVSYDLGSATQQFRDLYSSGTAHFEMVDVSNTTTLNGNITGQNGNVFVSGNIVVTSDVVSLASDRRLKTDLEPIRDALGTLKHLTGYTYTWRDDVDGLQVRGPDIGLVAQDLVEANLSECVTLAPFDTAPDGTSRSGDEYLAIRYNKLHAVTIEAVKQLSDRLDKLERTANQ